MRLLKNSLLLFLSFILLSASCKKDKQQPVVDELSKLPPPTQTGARTFGCLVNGKAFVPNNRGILQGPIMQCNYIYLNKGFYFLVSGSYKNKDGSIDEVIAHTDSLAEPIHEGQTINLTSFNVDGKSYGAFYIINEPHNSKTYFTTETMTGQLHITKLDQANFIVAGTFSFDAVDKTGDKVEVRNGRFDMIYTN